MKRGEIMPEKKSATKRRDTRKKELQGKLNSQQICFCHNYILDSSTATEAYQTAYPSCKSYEGARVNASRLLKKPEVKEYINILLDEQADLIEITEKEIYRELKRMALTSESETIRLKAIKQLTELKGMIQTGDNVTNNTLIQIGIVDDSGNVSAPTIITNDTQNDRSHTPELNEPDARSYASALNEPPQHILDPFVVVEDKDMEHIDK